MRNKLIAVLEDLRVSKSELLAKIATMSKNGRAYPITRMTLHNVLYKDTCVSEKSATTILKAVNSLAKEKKIAKDYDYPDLGLSRSQFKSSPHPLLVCKGCGHVFISEHAYDRHCTKDGCVSYEDMTASGLIESTRHVRMFADGKMQYILLTVWIDKEN